MSGRSFELNDGLIRDRMVSFKLSEAEDDTIDELCGRLGLSRSNVIRKGLQLLVEAELHRPFPGPDRPRANARKPREPKRMGRPPKVRRPGG